MRFLADMNVSPLTVIALRQAGHDAAHLRDEGLQHLPDADVFQKAQREGRVLLTFDLDFGEIVARTRAASPSVVVFRLETAPPALVSSLLLRVLSELGERLDRGVVVIVERHGYRVRTMPFTASD